MSPRRLLMYHLLNSRAVQHCWESIYLVLPSLLSMYAPILSSGSKRACNRNLMVISTPDCTAVGAVIYDPHKAAPGSDRPALQISWSILRVSFRKLSYPKTQNPRLFSSRPPLSRQQRRPWAQPQPPPQRPARPPSSAPPSRSARARTAQRAASSAAPAARRTAA